VSRVDELVAALCPAGVGSKALGDIGSIMRGRRFVKADMVESGTPCIHYGELYTTYATWATEAHSFLDPALASRLRVAEPGDVIFVSTGETVEDIGKAVAWLGAENVVIHDALYSFRSSLDPKYVAYFSQTREFHTQIRRNISSSKVSAISPKNLAKVRIPAPPLEIQREVVRILDRFAELEAEVEAELEAELDSRQRQLAYYRELLLDFSNREVRWVPLRELVTFISGKPHERFVDPEGAVALMTSRFISTQGRSARYVRPMDVLSAATRDDIALVMSDLPNGRALARAFYVDASGRYAANQRVCLLRTTDPGLLPRFLYYAVDRNAQLLAFDNRLDQTHLSKSQILDIRMPVPEIADQRRIVSTLDEFSALVSGLAIGLPAEVAARRKQYQFYRDRLLTFEEAG
jgi:type I restriction enzyme S subunit